MDLNYKLAVEEAKNKVIMTKLPVVIIKVKERFRVILKISYPANDYVAILQLEGDKITMKDNEGKELKKFTSKTKEVPIEDNPPVDVDEKKPKSKVNKKQKQEDKSL